MKRWRVLFITVLVSLCCLTAASASDPVVTREDFLLALQAAKPGDTIYVGDIVFKPSPQGIVVLNKSISIVSAKADGTNAVFTDATFSVSGSAGVEISISGVDFRGRAAEEVGDPDNMPNLSNPLQTQCAMFFSGNADVRFINCSFSGYRNQYGTVYAIYSSENARPNSLKLSFSGCSFVNNIARRGAAIYLSGFSRNVGLKIENCVFEKNIAESGAVLFADASLVEIEGCTFKSNISLTEGGALRLQNCSTTVSESRFEQNTAREKGSAISVLVSSFLGLSADNCSFVGNQSPDECCVFAEKKETNFDAESYAVFNGCTFEPECPALKENELVRIMEPEKAPEPPAKAHGLIYGFIAMGLVILVAVFVFIMNKRMSEPKQIVREAGSMADLEKILSNRELEVMNLYLTEKTRKEVADELCISESTVKKHIASVYSKLGVKTRQELVVKIMKLKENSPAE